MKFILAVLFIIGLSASAFAQNYSTAVSVSRPVPDGTRMEGGKVWSIKSGQKVLVQEEVTLSNGTHIKADGSVVTKSGYTAQLGEGDYINNDGRLIVAPTNTASAIHDDAEEEEDEE